MIAVVPETHKKPGVCYAIADDGLELPVIDVTHPAFAFEISDEQLSAQIDRFVQSLQAAAQLPPGAMAAMAQKSRLMRGLVAMGGEGYTSGMVTYLNKLGPDNLGEGYASPMDRQWAAGSRRSPSAGACATWRGCWRTGWRRRWPRDRMPRCSWSTSPAGRRPTAGTP